MPFFIFFVNRPLTILPYLFGLLLISIVSLLVNEPEGLGFILSFFFLWLPFTLWYPFMLFYYFFLSNDENIQIQGVNLNPLRKALKIALILHIAVIPIAIAISIWTSSLPFSGSFFLFVYSLFVYKFLEQCVIAKLISEGIRKNINLKNFDADTLYSEIRNILVSKLITR